jgi:hypothetical protein
VKCAVTNFDYRARNPDVEVIRVTCAAKGGCFDLSELGTGLNDYCPHGSTKLQTSCRAETRFANNFNACRDQSNFVRIWHGKLHVHLNHSILAFNTSTIPKAISNVHDNQPTPFSLKACANNPVNQGPWRALICSPLYRHMKPSAQHFLNKIFRQTLDRKSDFLSSLFDCFLSGEW